MKMIRLVVLGLVLALAMFGSAFASEFVYIEGQAVTVVDPAKHTDESSLHAVLNMYDPLVYPKVQEGLMEPGPHIAESWSASEDGTVYTFSIREGVTFHDGSDLTAEDVAFSMQRLLAIKKGFSWLFSNVLESENVAVVDEHTVTFTLNNAYAPFVPSLTQLFIVNKDAVMANLGDGDFGDMGDYGEAYLTDNVAGSGPYQLVRYERNTILEMEQFADYWRGWEEGQITHVFYRIVIEEPTQRTLVASGEAQMMDQWATPNTYAQLARTNGVTVDETPSAQLFHVQMNTQRPPLDDINVRKAIAHAFDYGTAIESIFLGAVQARGPVPMTAWQAYGREPQASAYTQDLELARSELAASGVDPSTISLDYVYPEGGNVQRQVGLLLQNNLAELDIALNLVELPWARIVELSATADTNPDMAAIYDTLKYPHPDSHLYGMYHPDAWGSYRTISRYGVDDVSTLLELARRSTDLDEQLDFYQQAEAQIVEDYPSLFIANPMHRIAFRDTVEGYQYVGLLGYDVAFYDFRVSE